LCALVGTNKGLDSFLMLKQVVFIKGIKATEYMTGLLRCAHVYSPCLCQYKFRLHSVCWI